MTTFASQLRNKRNNNKKRKEQAMKKNFKNVMSIGFKVKFDGRGCVNYDGGDQKYTLNRTGLYKGLINDNVKLAKKTFRTIEENDSEGNPQSITEFRHKVSSDCIRHDMFKDEMEFTNSLTSFIDDIYYSAIAQPAALERGYMFASSGCSTDIKKSPLCITDAIETGEWHRCVDFDVHSRAGKKADTTGSDAKDTSFFMVENVGAKQYQSEGSINLTELQFISADRTYDRGAVSVDGGPQEEKYMTAMRSNYGKDTRFGYYYMENGLTKDEWAERGILLSKANVDMLTKDIIRRLLNINIYRKDAFFKFNSIELQVVTTDSKAPVEIKIDKVEDIDNYQFDYYQKYLEASEDKIIANIKKAEDLKSKTTKSKKSK